MNPNIRQRLTDYVVIKKSQLSIFAENLNFLGLVNLFVSFQGHTRKVQKILWHIAQCLIEITV